LRQAETGTILGYGYWAADYRGKQDKKDKTIVPDVVEKTSIRRRSRIPCVVVEKITTRWREGVGVVVEKIKKVDELSTKVLALYLQQ